MRMATSFLLIPIFKRSTFALGMRLPCWATRRAKSKDEHCVSEKVHKILRRKTNIRIFFAYHEKFRHNSMSFTERHLKGTWNYIILIIAIKFLGG